MTDLSGPAEAILIQGARQFGIELTASRATLMLRLLDELNDWNQRMNLTAIRDRDQQLTKHLLDSLSLQPLLQGARVVDVGTGAGFPGLPLAIANPDREFTLLDSTAKKLKFVDHVGQLLGVANIRTVHARAESFRTPWRFDTVMSRAVGPLARFVDWSGHLCVGGGRLLAMKGRDPQEEIAALPSGWKVAAVHRVRVPGLDEERHIVEICRSHDRI